MSSESTAPGAGGASKQNLADVRALLVGALERVDEMRLPPEVGARLQELIDLLESFEGF